MCTCPTSFHLWYKLAEERYKIAEEYFILPNCEKTVEDPLKYPKAANQGFSVGVVPSNRSSIHMRTIMPAALSSAIECSIVRLFPPLTDGIQCGVFSFVRTHTHFSAFVDSTQACTLLINTFVVHRVCAHVRDFYADFSQMTIHFLYMAHSLLLTNVVCCICHKLIRLNCRLSQQQQFLFWLLAVPRTDKTSSVLCKLQSDRNKSVKRKNYFEIRIGEGLARIVVLVIKGGKKIVQSEPKARI